MTTRDLITDALIELGVLAPGDALSAVRAAFALSKLNRLLDNWNAERAAVYADVFSTFTITPSLQPHTIGPSGTFSLTQRPVSIEHASVILATDVRTPITIRDAQWWADARAPEITGTIPTDLYFEKSWPDGKLWLWPIPTVANQIELQHRIVLAALGLDTAFTMPPGYQDATTLTLAETLAPSYGAPISADLAVAAQKARGRVFANNDEPRRLCTHDAGMPGGGHGQGFNYRTGGY
jgi:hypothetical protein